MGPQVYRTGFALSAPPQELPAGLKYEEFPGGKYSHFVLTGPYSLLGLATGQAWNKVAEGQTSDDYAIENYVNDPRQTPEEQLITEILIPTS